MAKYHHLMVEEVMCDMLVVLTLIPRHTSSHLTNVEGAIGQAIMACRRKIPCAVCSIPIVDGKDEAIFCEGSCKQWFHRGCASLPPERYKELSSTDEPFLCLTCTCLTFKKEMSTLSATVTNLCEELQDALKMQESISALRREISTLKESLKHARSQLEEAKHSRPKQQPRSYADTVNNAGATISSQRNGTNMKSPPKHAKIRAGSATQKKSRNDNFQHAGKYKVVGARRIWGPFYYCSPIAVLSCIRKVTGIDAKFRIKKKTKELTSNKTIWWFVVHGDEKELCALDGEWNKVQLQTSWRLENCFAPLSTQESSNPSSSGSNQDSDPSRPSPANSPSTSTVTEAPPSPPMPGATGNDAAATAPDTRGSSPPTNQPTEPSRLSPTNHSNHISMWTVMCKKVQMHDYLVSGLSVIPPLPPIM